MSASLYSSNHPAAFWKPMLEPAVEPGEWEEAARGARDTLPPAVAAGDPDLGTVLARVLGEEQFGPDHFRLTSARRAYYVVKPVLPRALTRRLRRLQTGAGTADFALGWPLEERWTNFLKAVLARVADGRGLRRVRFVHPWPDGARWALVLTHDVETAEGVARVPMVAELEERYGVRSSFNFVPDRYEVPASLLADLRRRGFEIGVHDWNHDGKLFSSRRRFQRRARDINRQVQTWHATGFRAALTLRHPEWMQQLDIEYDLSFFDTDPFEPMPGGTMSIWPFQMGRFVELPYTLVQDYTLAAVLAERTCDVWTEKVSHIASHWGMALLNTHPDYLGREVDLSIYTRFLETMREYDDCWHALPREVAAWWAVRHHAGYGDVLDRARTATATLDANGALTLSA